MALPLLHNFMIIGIVEYNSAQQQGGLASSTTTGYQFTCTCNTVSSSVCTAYSCSLGLSKASCFAGRSKVKLSDGSFKELSQLKIGESVLANQNKTYEPVTTFIHARHEGLFTFLAFKVQSTVSNQSSTLFVSPNHLLFNYDSGEAQFAGRFRVGNRVQYIDEDEIVAGEIIDIQLTHETGYYAPLTASGIIVVDKVVASNYATVSNHYLAHKMMTIYRWWISIIGQSSTWNENIPSMLESWLEFTKNVPTFVSSSLLNTHVYDGKFQVSSIA